MTPQGNIGRFGNVGPGQLVGPGTKVFSAKLQKKFHVREQTYFQVHHIYVAVDEFVKNPEAADSSQALNCDLTEALNRWKISVGPADEKGFTVVAFGLPDSKDTKDLTVTYHFVRDGESTWEEH